jgi:hypothetical protein
MAADAAEIDNLICCLEFLAREADGAGLKNIGAIIRRSIQEIMQAYESLSGRKFTSASTDILLAFKLLARFCLIDEPERKQQIVRLIEAIDRETLAAYAL